MRTRFFFLIVLLSLGLDAQSFKGLRYLGEIGHLGPPFSAQTVADLKIARVDADAEYTIQGTDDAGKPWRADISVASGIGWTDVWEGDFDANARRDLMIAATFPTNGRCLDPATITFLMFDSRGRPVPWTLDTWLPKNGGQGKVPALLRDFKHSGRPELIATACENSNLSRPFSNGENRSVAGIYQAQDAHWKLIRPADAKPLAEALRSNYLNANVRLNCRLNLLSGRTSEIRPYESPQFTSGKWNRPIGHVTLFRGFTFPSTTAALNGWRAIRARSWGRTASRSQAAKPVSGGRCLWLTGRTAGTSLLGIPHGSKPKSHSWPHRILRSRFSVRLILRTVAHPCCGFPPNATVDNALRARLFTWSSQRT